MTPPNQQSRTKTQGGAATALDEQAVARKRSTRRRKLRGTTQLFQHDIGASRGVPPGGLAQYQEHWANYTSGGTYHNQRVRTGQYGGNFSNNFYDSYQQYF
jgi:hypothetical protein